jgi:hypothetical protein
MAFLHFCNQRHNRRPKTPMDLVISFSGCSKHLRLSIGVILERMGGLSAIGHMSEYIMQSKLSGEDIFNDVLGMFRVFVIWVAIQNI